MSANPTTMLLLTLLLVMVFVLGFVLQRRGRPHSVLLLTAHKLIALAALAIMAVTVIRINQAAPLDAAALVVAMATAVFFVVAIVSGGLVSTDKPAAPLARVLHWVTPFLTVAGVVATFLLVR
ncbi:MAG: hypothetical protein WA040_00925 [Anaerolineae bacterium]